MLMDSVVLGLTTDEYVLKHKVYNVGSYGKREKNLIPSGLEIIPGIVDPSNTTRFGYELMYVGAAGSTAPPINFYVGNSTFSPRGG